MKSFDGVTQVKRPRGGVYRELVRRAVRINRPLAILGVAMLITFLATLAGVLVDHRVITGAPAWLKPAKFAISISVYSFTFVWLLSFVENRPRLVGLIANVTVVSVIVEMIVIITQAARGTTSHFNLSTPLNSFLWISMGIFIVLVWAMNLLLAILLIRQRMPDRAFVWSLRLGVLISAVGMGAGFLMVGPTPLQRAALAAGQGPHIVGAHSVGVADGGPGLPIVGWSTVGGDLRVAHFVGLHALQVLPFLGWFLTRRRSLLARLSEGNRLALVWTGGLAYLGLVLLLIWQALRGQSVVNPDARTIAVAGALAASFTIVVVVSVARLSKTERTTSSLISAKPNLSSGGRMKGMISISILALLLIPARFLGQDTPQPRPDVPSVQTDAASSSSSRNAMTPRVSASSDPPRRIASLQADVKVDAAPGLDDKFRYYLAETYLNPSAITAPAFRAGLRMANPPGKGATQYPREWRQGAEAFGRNYGDAFAERATFQTARLVTGVITREDLRYTPSSSRNFFSRSLYAIGFTFVDRSDSGHHTPALSNFAGAAAAGFVGNAYLPTGFDDVTHAGQRAILRFGTFAGGNLFREFAPQMPRPIRTLFMLIAR